MNQVVYKYAMIGKMKVVYTEVYTEVYTWLGKWNNYKMFCAICVLALEHPQHARG